MTKQTERMLNRCKSIYLFIRNKGDVTTKELQEEYNVCQRTIQRDLRILQHNGLVFYDNCGNWKITDRKVKVA
ncbi:MULTISPECIES: DeoR family transcriptional regulator [Bacillus cereus group]|uniref:Alkaline phosphatase n=1 Tax=Bacillus cereus TaxID=1396 RepID=A0A9X6W1E7_BACCE|nr:MULTISPECIES: DeoR family transcriptional regulator [Bacillus cereus group]PFF51836.1 alkaline phosphatase [Bacillus cereus]PGB10039.1 alkaline phosphatase [Bacillus toyonensis]